MTAIRILVSGSRDWTDEGAVAGALLDVVTVLPDEPDGTRPEVTVIHGACTEKGTNQLCGADGIADALADAAGWTVERFPADWYGPCDPEFCNHGDRRADRNGRDYCPAAGPRRNAAMVERIKAYRDLGDQVVMLAFPLAKSPGTRGAMRLADTAGIPVHVHEGTPT